MCVGGGLPVAVTARSVRGGGPVAVYLRYEYTVIST